MRSCKLKEKKFYFQKYQIYKNKENFKNIDEETF